MKHIIIFLSIICLSATAFAQYNDYEEDAPKGLFGAKNAIANIQVGVWNPIGSLSNTFGPSPYIGYKMGGQISRNNPYFIDFGFDFVVPIAAKEFNYSQNQHESFQAKPTIIYELGLWLRHEERIKRDVYFNKYIGVGFSGFSTDQSYYLDEEYYDEETGQYYTEENEKSYAASTFFINIGGDIRYKHYGIFAEFNYIPYGNSSKLEDNFGNKSVTMGVNVRF